MTTDREYRGHRIHLTGDMKFQATGPLFDAHASHGGHGVETFDSFEKAKEKIDRLHDMQRKQEMETLELPVIDHKGRRGKIRSIHMGQGKLLLTKELKDTEGDLYPDVPWVHAELAEREVLQNKIRELNSRLTPLAISKSRGYGRVRPERYDKLFDELKAEHAHKLAYALKLQAKAKAES